MAAPTTQQRQANAVANIIAMTNKMMGDKTPEYVKLSASGRLMAQKGLHEPAVKCFKGALSAWKAAADQDPSKLSYPDFLCQCQNQLGCSLSRLGKHKEAAKTFRKAVKAGAIAFSATGGTNAPQVRAFRRNLAECLLTGMELNSALMLYKELLEVDRKNKDSEDIAASVYGIAVALNERREFVAAEEYAREALLLRVESFSKGDALAVKDMKKAEKSQYAQRCVDVLSASSLTAAVISAPGISKTTEAIIICNRAIETAESDRAKQLVDLDTLQVHKDNLIRIRDRIKDSRDAALQSSAWLEEDLKRMSQKKDEKELKEEVKEEERDSTAEKPVKHAASSAETPGRCAADGCAQPGSRSCSACKSVSYCSKECQRKHWKSGHKAACSTSSKS